MSERLVLLGCEHPLFGAVTAGGTADGRSGLAISAGGDPSTTNWESKGDPQVPNEDACCAIDADALVLLAVADSHFGHRASHDMIQRVAAGEVPRTPEELEVLIEALRGLPAAGDDSESSLAIAVMERHSGVGFGVCFGDSTVATVDSRGVDVWSVALDDFVAPGDAESFARAGRRFRLLVPDGSFLVVFTDGVDGCGGRSGTSIGPRDLQRLRSAAGPDAADFARQLVELALSGVDGHEGGHDNIAVAAAGR